MKTLEEIINNNIEHLKKAKSKLAESKGTESEVRKLKKKTFYLHQDPFGLYPFLNWNQGKRNNLV